MGRPQVFDRDEILNKLNAYIDSTPDPMLQEFCLDINNPCRDTLNEWSKTDNRFSDTIKRLLGKQEVFLTRAKDVNPVMAIFRLKQPVFGYTDKQQVDIDGKLTQSIVVSLVDDEE